MPDGEIDIADAALQLARVDAPDADWQAARAHLSDIARDAVLHVRAMSTPDDLAAQAGALAALLTGRHGYGGDSETYDDLANANLIRVIERRRGLPVALGILWLHAAHAAGWSAHGIDFPGHFLIALSAGQAQVVLDVFAGGEPLDARRPARAAEAGGGIRGRSCARAARGHGHAGGAAAAAEQHQAAAADGWRRARAALACAEDMLRIAPAEAPLWREAH